MTAKRKKVREGWQKIDLLWNGKEEVYFKGWRRWMIHKKANRVSGVLGGVFEA